jgi:sec-independent protein translocase protein TatB
MFDFGIGYTEIFVVALVAILVIGPKDLPRVLRAVGKTVGKMRGMAREFQGHLDSAMREAGLEDVKREMQGLKSLAKVDLESPAARPASKPAPASADVNAFKTYFGEAAAALPAPAPGAGEGAS